MALAQRAGAGLHSCEPAKTKDLVDKKNEDRGRKRGLSNTIVESVVPRRRYFGTKNWDLWIRGNFLSKSD